MKESSVGDAAKLRIHDTEDRKLPHEPEAPVMDANDVWDDAWRLSRARQEVQSVELSAENNETCTQSICSSTMP